VQSNVLLGSRLCPAARTLGIDEIHHAVVAVLAMGLGHSTLPFGLGFYFSHAIGGTQPDGGMEPGLTPSRRVAARRHPGHGSAVAIDRLPLGE
jgi:TRAP-type C4-dicarboxylate transport system permease large subunit